MSKLTYDRVQTTGSNAVNAAQLLVSPIDTRTIEQAILDASGSGGGTFSVEFRTITGGENTANQLTLAAAPLPSSSTIVLVSGGTAQFYGADYTVSGAVLSWAGLGLDGIITTGTNLIILYPDSAGGGSGGDVTQIEYFTLDPADITNEYVDLNTTPTDPAVTQLFLIGGSAQEKGVDWQLVTNGISLRRVSWNGLSLDGQLTAGDRLMVVYYLNATTSAEAVNVQVDTITPFTGNLAGATEVQGALDIVDGLLIGGGGTGEVTHVQHFVTDGIGTVGGFQYVDLATTPSDSTTVRVTVVGGSEQLNSLLSPGQDFTVISDGISVKRVSWAGLGMLSALSSAGIYFVVEYTVNVTSPDQALNVQTDTTNFNTILSPAHTEVQAALDALDNHTHLKSLHILKKVVDTAVTVTTGTNIYGSIEIPVTGTIVSVGAWVQTAGVGGATIVDINRNGSTIMAATKISIDASGLSSRTAATPPVLTTTSVTAGDFLTFDVDSVPGTPPLGLSIRLEIQS